MKIRYLAFCLTLVASLLVSSCAANASPTEVSVNLPAATHTSLPANTPVPSIPTTTSSPMPSVATTATESPTAVQGPITLTDGLGNKLTLEKTPQKIISLAPSNTEILFAIGAGGQVVGRDEVSDYPEAAQQLPSVGGSFGQLDTEKIVSLQPDLVLAAAITPPEQIQALEKLNLQVYYLPNPTDLNSLYANLETVAQLTGHLPEAQKLIQSMKSRVEAVQQKVAALSNHPLVFYELDSTDPNAPWTSGPGTFIDTLIDMAGGTNLGHILSSDWAQVNVETLIQQNPDIILLGDYTYGNVTPQDVMAREGWKDIKAIKDGQVYPFDDNLVSRPGPRLVDGLEALAKILHPDQFK
jgi:iron complex transport system substrate-binding protein